MARSDDGWSIHRHDFHSFTDADFHSTDLTIEKNRYTLNSWLRIFVTLAGLRNSGLLIHGAGVSLSSGIYIFAGPSGSGKSTLVKLIGKEHALSDELVFVKKQQRGIRAYGTPFWGELKKDAGKTFEGPLRGLLFLSHGNSCVLSRVDPGTALKKLLQTVLFFSDNTAALDEVLALGADIISTVPVYLLTFSLKNTREEIICLVQKGMHQ